MTTLHSQRNRLGEEHSPYLLQHRNNPIWWQSWNHEAFTIAKNLDKPIFLSIGYSTCHWCHVMEGDSFEKIDVAALLNQSFISIKVDREERPDVDSIYMTVAQMMTGRGGWPLSILMTPDRKPFWAGTFVPRVEFKRLLVQVAQMWASEKKMQLIQSSDQITSELQRISQPHPLQTVLDSEGLLKKFFQESLERFDQRHGGFATAPKFPPAMSIMALLRLHRRSKSTRALSMVTKTLDHMARGGLHDHLGGGFHRYATDEKWFIPHFEKMLYDNALLTLAYLEGWQVTQNPEYLHVAKKTLDYVLRDLQHDDGGFFSAEDADSEKTEGKFYVWQLEELEKILTLEELAKIIKTYRITLQGNYQVSHGIAEIEREAGLLELEKPNILSLQSEDKLDSEDPILDAAHKKLFVERNKRVRPGLDDKILTSWNGLMIGAMARASIVTKDKTYLKAAERASEFIEKNLVDANARLLHRFRDGDARFRGYLEDYSYLIFGYIELYQATFDDKWMTRALHLQEMQDELFFDPSHGGYFDIDGQDSTLLHRPKDFGDNAVPSGNSVSAYNLIRLASFTQNQIWREKSIATLSAAIATLSDHPSYFPFLLLTADFLQDDSKEIVFVGDSASDVRDFSQILQSEHFSPNQIVVLRQQDDTSEHKNWRAWTDTKIMLNDAPTAYVCVSGSCQLPTNDPAEAWRLVEPHLTIDLSPLE